MGWQTVDRKSTGLRLQQEDAERRELRLRRTYNEAAAGHAMVAKGAAEAPAASAVDALYWSVLVGVGTCARGDAEEAWAKEPLSLQDH